MFRSILLVPPPTDLDDLTACLYEATALARPSGSQLSVLQLGESVSRDTTAADPQFAPYVSESAQYTVSNGRSPEQQPISHSDNPILLPYPAAAGRSLFERLSEETGVELTVDTRDHQYDRTSTIVAAAESIEADLVIVSSAGTGGLGARTTKSLSERLLNELSVPVLTVNLRASRSESPEEIWLWEPESTTEASTVSLVTERLPAANREQLRTELVGALLYTGQTVSDGQTPFRVFETEPSTDTDGQSAVRVTAETGIRINCVDGPLVAAPHAVPEATSVSVVSSGTPLERRAGVRESLVGTTVHTGLLNIEHEFPSRIFATDPPTDSSGADLVKITPNTQIRLNVVAKPLTDDTEGLVTSYSGRVLRADDVTSSTPAPKRDILIVNTGPVGSSLRFNQQISSQAIGLAARMGGTVHALWVGLIGGYSTETICFVDPERRADDAYSDEDHIRYAAELFEKRAAAASVSVKRLAAAADVTVVCDHVTASTTAIDVPVVHYAAEHDLELAFLSTTGEKAGRIRTALGDSLTERLIKESPLSVITLNVRNAQETPPAASEVPLGSQQPTATEHR